MDHMLKHYDHPPEPVTALMPRIQQRARRLSRGEDSAQDLAQETALRLCQRLREDRAISNLEAYAMITLRHLAISRWRGLVPTEPMEDDIATTTPEAPARIALAELMQAIDRLPSDQADLLHRVAQGDTSPAVLAQQTGIPIGTVMSRLARARSKLRAELQVSKDAPVSGLY